LLDLAVITVAEPTPPVGAVFAVDPYELCAELVADCRLVVVLVVLLLLPQPASSTATTATVIGKGNDLAAAIELASLR
jgi:hypothetical protein